MTIDSAVPNSAPMVLSTRQSKSYRRQQTWPNGRTVFARARHPQRITNVGKYLVMVSEEETMI
ncbi:MAG: hypothetical protein OET44_13525 [Gammaproteobacteria bacterium]|nr:hypothetical protein [Gammaproteobacteria bacterium]